MIAPHYLAEGISLYEGEALETLSHFKTASVDCVVTSPPYWKLRDYGHADQVGQEDDWVSYMSAILHIFSEVKRVMKPDGTCWINIGDKWDNGQLMSATDIPSVLQHMGGWVRAQTFIWHKTNATPYGAARRSTQDHEYIFLMAPTKSYFFNRKGVMVPAKWERWGKQTIKKDYRGIQPIDMDSLEERRKEGKPVRTVWSMPTRPYGGEHTAAFPPELAARCIMLGCPDNGLVLDPFIGSGSTAAAAKMTGRRVVGIDLRSDYLNDTVARWETVV